MLFIAVVALVYLFGAFDVARTAIERQRLANAADAAAFSAVQLQSQAMNTLAYTNRAMIANEVAIAQAVGLAAWTDYLERAADTASTAAEPFPAIAPLSTTFVGTAEAVSAIARQSTRLLAGNAAAAGQVLADAQVAIVHEAITEVPETLERIVTAHDPRYRIDADVLSTSLRAHRLGWQGLVRRVDASDREAMTRRVDLIERSLDGFSGARNWSLGTSAGGVGTHFEKRGATRLVAGAHSDGHAWLAKDMLAWRTELGGASLELPIGWGIALAGERAAGTSCTAPRGHTPSPCGLWYLEVRMTEELAETASSSASQVLAAYTGPHAHHVVASDVDADAPVRLRVRVALDDGDERNGRPTRRTYASPGPAGLRAAAISVAELIYREPDAPREGDPAESSRANAYMPYWSVRLVDDETSSPAMTSTLAAETDRASP